MAPFVAEISQLQFRGVVASTCARAPGSERGAENGPAGPPDAIRPCELRPSRILRLGLLQKLPLNGAGGSRQPAAFVRPVCCLRLPKNFKLAEGLFFKIQRSRWESRICSKLL